MSILLRVVPTDLFVALIPICCSDHSSYFLSFHCPTHTLVGFPRLPPLRLWILRSVSFPRSLVRCSSAPSPFVCTFAVYHVCFYLPFDFVLGSLGSFATSLLRLLRSTLRLDRSLWSARSPSFIPPFDFSFTFPICSFTFIRCSGNSRHVRLRIYVRYVSFVYPHTVVVHGPTILGLGLRFACYFFRFLTTFVPHVRIGDSSRLVRLISQFVCCSFVVVDWCCCCYVVVCSSFHVSRSVTFRSFIRCVPVLRFVHVRCLRSFDLRCTFRLASPAPRFYYCTCAWVCSPGFGSSPAHFTHLHGCVHCPHGLHCARTVMYWHCYSVFSIYSIPVSIIHWYLLLILIIDIGIYWYCVLTVFVGILMILINIDDVINDIIQYWYWNDPIVISIDIDKWFINEIQLAWHYYW